MTTSGWQLYIQWKYGSTDWVEPKNIKQSNIVELADYAKRVKIDDEPVFAWWVTYIQKKREIIWSKVKSKYWQRTHKYGIPLPNSVKESYELGEENNNYLWQKSIEEEMEKVKASVAELITSPENLVGYQEIDFDIKLGENFSRKDRLVAGGHKKKAPSSITYSSVVSRYSVRMYLLIVELKNLDIQSAYIGNA